MLECSRSHDTLTPAEGYSPGPVCALLHKWLVELAALPGVDGSPAALAVVLQTCDAGTEKWRKLAPTARTLTLVTHLVI